LLLHHMCHESPQPFDFHLDLVPLCQPRFLSLVTECHTFRCAGQYDISGLQCHIFRCIADDLLTVENHVVSVRILSDLPIHTAADPQFFGIFVFIFLYYAVSQRAESIQCLPNHPLSASALSPSLTPSSSLTIMRSCLLSPTTSSAYMCPSTSLPCPYSEFLLLPNSSGCSGAALFDSSACFF